MRLYELDDVIAGGDAPTLPEDVVNAFTELGSNQRGLPERLMLKAQHLLGGGVMCHAIEHVGDLSHRMSHMARYGNDGREYVKDKTDKMLRLLKSGYGFEREHAENLANNASYYKKDPEQFKHEVNDALEAYAHAHRKLTVYNRAQWLAREAAFSLGLGIITRTVRCLEELDKMASTPDFTKYAFHFERDFQGNLLPYQPTE